MFNSISKRIDSHFWDKYGYHFLFILTVFVAALVRSVYLFPERIWPDEALYAWLALRIYNNPLLIFSKEIIQFHPPLFPILLAIGHIFISPPELACHVMAVIMNIMGIIAIYILGIKISSRFLGLFCAITLSFNFFYINNSTYILIDGPLILFLILLNLSLLKVSEDNPRIYDVYVGLMGAVVILLKWSGALVIPFIISFYLLGFPKLSFHERLKKALIPISIIITLCVLLLANNFFQLGSILPDISALKGFGKAEPFWYYIVKFHNIVVMPYIIPFFLYGLYLSVKKRDRKSILLLTWFITFLVGISLTQEKVLRYGLLILPSSLLISGLGLEDLLGKLFKTPSKIEVAKIFSILCVLLFSWQLYPRTIKLLDMGIKNMYIGFRDAGYWIKRNYSDGALIMTASKRAIRYYSRVNYKEFGGAIVSPPKTKVEFEETISRSKGPIILVVDRWEVTQPSWIYPFSEGKMKYLKSLGFQLKKEIKGKTFISKEKRKILPIVWIFRR